MTREPKRERRHAIALQLLFYSKSLLLLFFGFLVLLVLLGHLFISERNASIRAIEKERHGLTYIDQLRESLEYVQKHRGMALLVGSDDESVPIKLAEIRSIIDETFFALRGINGHLNDRVIGDHLKALVGKWVLIKEQVSTMSASDSFAAHSRLAADLIALKRYVVDASGLIREPTLDGYYMVDLVGIQLPMLTERIGQLRAVGAHMQTGGAGMSDVRMRLALDLERLEERNRHLRHNLRTIFNTRPDLKAHHGGLIEEAMQGMAQFSGLIRRVLESEEFTIKGGTVFDSGTHAIDKLLVISDHVIPELDALLKSRIEDHRQQRLVMIGGLLAVMFAIIYLLTSRIRLEQLVEKRTRGLKAMNRELEAFSYSVAHDLRTPLRAINAFSQILQEEQEERLTNEGKRYLGRICASTLRMAHLIDGLLELSKVYRSGMVLEKVNLSAIARDIATNLQESDPGRRVTFEIASGLTALGDTEWLRVLLQNLLENAWKFTVHCPDACIQLGAYTDSGWNRFYVRDNGAGFEPQFSHKLFKPFERLHDECEFAGTGIGLATARRIVERHGGKIWAEGVTQVGAIFYFSLLTINMQHHKGMEQPRCIDFGAVRP